MHSVREEIKSEGARSEIENRNPDGPMSEAVGQLVALANLALARVLEADGNGGVRHQQNSSAGQYPTEHTTTSTAGMTFEDGKELQRCAWAPPLMY